METMYVSVHCPALCCLHAFSCSEALDGYSDYKKAMPCFRRNHSGFDDTILAVSAEGELVSLDRKVST
jgi:hypothetical protein